MPPGCLKVAKYEAVNLTAKTATLVLENPRVISARLNHDPKTGGSRFYKVDNYGVALLVPGTDGQTNAMNLALQKGQREIEAACATPDFFAAAKRSAESVLQPTVSATKWNIKLVWR